MIGRQEWRPTQLVRDWLLEAGLPVSDRPTLAVDQAAREMACALIEEEAGELRAAIGSEDIVGVADAVADLLWVTLEAAATFGIPIEPVFEEVHRSNRTKLRGGRRTVNAAGKIVAGPGYSPPDLRPILEAHAGERPTGRRRSGG